MNYLHILILAIIQGAAELLPVSSSAHVIVTAKLLRAAGMSDLDPTRPEFHFLLVMLHTGTMFAVLLYFWPRWRSLLTVSPAGSSMRASLLHFVLMILLATICTAVVGFGLKELIERVVLGQMMGRQKAEIEEIFHSLPLMAVSLFTVGVLILVAGIQETKAEVQSISPRSSVWIGVIQGLCLPFRGFSRSGATISTALLRGVARPLAEDFSFALAVVITPPVVAREYLRFRRDAAPDVQVLDLLLPGLVGMVFSFLAGLLALKLLSAALENGRWGYFGVYCLLASLGVLAAALAGL